VYVWSSRFYVDDGGSISVDVRREDRRGGVYAFVFEPNELSQQGTDVIVLLDRTFLRHRSAEGLAARVGGHC
jgi:hypothetical protein